MQKTIPKKPKPDNISLVELFAINATGPSRQLLKKYGKQDATGYEDLMDKLSDLVKTAKDKVEIEKAFADIHPHKDFILKYLTPPPTKTKVILSEPESSCEGNPNCSCDKKSNLEGEMLKQKTLNPDFLIACVSIVAITGLVIYATKNIR